MEESVNSVEYDANYWRKKSALFIAIHFQKYTRGKKCRKEAHRNIWVQYNRAAIIIQRCKTIIQNFLLQLSDEPFLNQKNRLQTLERT